MLRIRVTMRFNLIDVLIGVSLMLVGTSLTHFTLGFEPRQYLLPAGLLAGAITYLLLSPLIYRRFRIRPMWFPKCPVCKDKNRWFRFVDRKPNWPRDRIVCSSCSADVELWYERPNKADVATTTPGFELLWPQS